jgi:CheY-like chemotaxis protein
MQAIIDNLLFPTAMLLIGGALVGVWGFLRRGMVATVKDIAGSNGGRGEAVSSEKQHVGPCTDLIEHKKQSVDNWKEIFMRLASLDITAKETQQTMIRLLERNVDVEKQINFLSSRMGYREAKKADDVIPSRHNKEPKTLLLLVDDRPESLAALVTMIEALGFAVTIVNNASDGLAAIGTAPFKVAVIDAEMDTKTDGIELAAWIKRDHPEIDVILYTGHELEYTPPNVHYFRKNDWKDLMHHLASVKQKEVFNAEAKIRA